ncbi:hypothetical protein ACS0TY_005671 [Phlomoides rotata]
MTSSGMRATESYRYLAHTVGGEENVGHIIKDHINFINRVKSRTQPDIGYEMAGIVRHASEVYTLTLFKEFNKEFMKGISATSTLIGEHDTTTFYRVTSLMGDSSNEVIFDSSMKLITCDCLKFELFGMLCCHSLRILLINYVDKNSKIKSLGQVWDKFGKVSLAEKVGKNILWRYEITRKFYNLVLRAEENEDVIRIIEESHKRDSLVIDALNSTKNVDVLTDASSSTKILDPTRSKTKGRGKRAKGHFETSKKKKVGTSNSIQSKEFGSKTPKQYLF